MCAYPCTNVFTRPHTQIQYRTRVEQGPQKLVLTEGEVLQQEYDEPGYPPAMRTLEVGSWVCVENPYDPELKACRQGEREIRVGPCVFPLYPGETIKVGSDACCCRSVCVWRSGWLAH